MPNNEKDFVTETKEAMDRIEDILSGSLSFLGRYLSTIWYYLLSSSFSLENLGAEMRPNKTLKPLSFLTFSLLIFSLSYFRVLKELYDANWLKPEFKMIVERIVAYHDLVASSAFEFQLSDALLLMIPLVLFVALFAKINELISILVRKRTSLEQQLSLISYFLGTVVSMLALWSLPLLYFMSNYKNNELSSAFEIAIGIVIIVLAIVTIITAFFRYIQHCKYQFYHNWAISFLIVSAASLLQMVAMRITIKLFMLT